jgi:hypothetical protein
MKLVLLFVTSTILAGCIFSPKYKVGDCATCEFEDTIPGAPNLVYQVTAINKDSKTYSVTAFSDKSQNNEKIKMVVDAANKLYPTMTFEDLDRSSPQGRAPKCTMRKIACP